MKIIDKKYRKNFGKFVITAISVVILTLTTSTQLWAANETFNSGAYIIDMGASNQTFDNGLKPYGLLYDLIVNENVPVRWAINPTKAKDGIDFSVDGYNFATGPFIIPIEYLSADVLTVIGNWQADGVIVIGPVSGFTAPIYTELTSWPRAVLDQQNGHIVADYYDNAGVPTSSYILAGDPTDLTGCGDIYVLPHADPHLWPDAWGQALYDFIVNDQGYLWAACHSVSALETLVDFNGDGNNDMNFLSDTELIPWKNIDGYSEHSDGTPPYTYNQSYSGDPIMQFMGTLDGATTNGSEQIYVPMSGMTWRSTTKNAVYDPDHPDNPVADYASILAYGYAFGNPNYGMVMYEAGHDHDKNSHSYNVAAQRAYFNFVLMAGANKQISVSSTVPTFVVSESTINISASGSDGNAPYTYEWTSSCVGGTFGDPNSASTTYTAPFAGSDLTCVITVTVTDNCGRFTFESTSVVVGPASGPTAVDDNATTPMNTPVDIPEMANDVKGDADLDPTSITFVGGTAPNPTTEGTFTVHPSTGLVTFTPVNGFTGTVDIDYSVCDLNSLCDIATIIVVITPVDGPTAVDDNVFTPLDTPVDIDILDNDIEGDGALDPTTVSFEGTPPNPTTEGTFVVHPSTGLVTFMPVTGFTGIATIDYEVCDVNSLCSIATITVTITTGTDTDGDGCPDDVDDYPEDPTRCFDIYYPANGNGTLAYEDLWPSKGDYDFNDLVIEYRFKTVMSGTNHIVETFADFTIKAFGAGFENGFGFQLANDNIADADILSVTGYNLQEAYINLETNGIEEDQSIPTVIVYDNTFNIMEHPGQGIGVNTEPWAPYVAPVTLNIYMSFTQSTYSYAQLDIPNFNPFIMVNLNRGTEVHLPNYNPTDLANEGQFGTWDDDSDSDVGRYYKTESNLPWAIHIPEPFDYPIEKQDIIWVHLKFAEWAESGGTLFQDWYKDLPGYRDNSLIYDNQP